MLTVEDIKKAINDTDFEFYGLRVDDGIRYNVGDTANNSHQLFQDPDFDEDGELIYPYIDDGTCVIGFDANDDASIAKAIERIKIYFGDNIHLLGSDYAEGGYDIGELIVKDAEVLEVYDK